MSEMKITDVTVQALLFRIVRAANGLPPILKFTQSIGSNEFARTTTCLGMSSTFMQQMEQMGRGGDVVMISKADLMKLLEVLQDPTSAGVRIVGCNGYPIRTSESPFGRENVGKKVIFG
jgi:hypothetical protein